MSSFTFSDLDDRINEDWSAAPVVIDTGIRRFLVDRLSLEEKLAGDRFIVLHAGEEIDDDTPEPEIPKR